MKWPPHAATARRQCTHFKSQYKLPLAKLASKNYRHYEKPPQMPLTMQLPKIIDF
jgi:hypothetical protein